MHSRQPNRLRGGATAAEMPPRQPRGGVHRAGDVALRAPKRAWTRPAVPAEGWKRRVRGFWYRTTPHGLDDGSEGLETALSAQCRDGSVDDALRPQIGGVRAG